MQKVTAFRAYDSKLLSDTYSLVAQIQANIENLCKNDTKLEDLPTSMLPTDKLYEIVISFEAMYQLLVDSHLLKDGHAKNPSLLLH